MSTKKVKRNRNKNILAKSSNKVSERPMRRSKKSAKIPNAGLMAGEAAKRLERTQISKYHSKGGHGFAAEDANARADRIKFKRVVITGISNEADGSDRIVDGIPVQTKYFSTARETVNAAFDGNTGFYRYQKQKLEVPKDQYDECVKIMREKIAQGKVAGYRDPKKAKYILKRGAVTYKQARNIARAGNVDSLIFDAQTQAVTSSYIFAISFAIHYAKMRWNGEKHQQAIQGALRSAIAPGGTTLISGIVSGQLLRSRSAAVGAVLMRSGIKNIYKTSVGKIAIEKLATASMGKTLSGAAAFNHVAKLLRSNIITTTVATTVITTPNFYRAAFARSISWPQFGKDLIVDTVSIAGGFAGWMGGTAAGAAIGSAVPIIGTAAGGIAGGICGTLIGGTISAKGTKAIADRFIEDDVKRMCGILQSVVESLACEYLLSENEIQTLSVSVKKDVSPKWLRQMYRAGIDRRSDEDRRSFAYKHFDKICLKIVKKRPKFLLPTAEEVRSHIDLLVHAVQIPRRGATCVST